MCDCLKERPKREHSQDCIHAKIAKFRKKIKYIKIIATTNIKYISRISSFKGFYIQSHIYAPI
ncbi:hypothetical protein [Plasmodium yoelii yoelii]|uniref:Uncharacterized protein n=1 Tax=Plasmodium yoelii yoelii TaxID=73239 RepID=Q7RPA6_PLAYO|nr:hypothetical protein [Plasmodium yoelii yoelii]